MANRKRIFYLGMIASDTYGTRVGEKTFTGAAARKMMTVARAMRSEGHRAVVVSLPFVGTRAKRSAYGPVVAAEGGVPTAYLGTLRNRYLRKALGPLLLAGFCIRRIAPDDTVIFYNHAIEYLPALLILKLRNVKIVQDIEDAPILKQRSLRELMNRFAFDLTFAMTHPRKMVVADHVARGLKLSDYIVIRGVAAWDGNAATSLRAKWAELHRGGALRLHFGGTLISETGIDLFCDAVEQLASGEKTMARPVVFSVTGTGDLDKIRALQASVRERSDVSVELGSELSKAEYIAAVESCHGSLSLKRPGADISNTTFPSKVIEITAAGLALVSTRLGDVAELFDDESAFFLDDYTPGELARIIVEMAQDSERVERIATLGYAVCNRAFSEKAVGEAMGKLV